MFANRFFLFLRGFVFIVLSVIVGVLCCGRNALPASSTADDVCVSFLLSYGWETEEDMVETVYLTLPEEFDAVYREYNALQKKQGFDLERYKGKNIIKNVYKITNYPGFENDETIRANVYTLDGKVIGADICSVRLDGFMHGVNECLYGKVEIG